MSTETKEKRGFQAEVKQLLRSVFENQHFEVKTDFEAGRTGNVFVEVEDRGKKSGLSITKSPYWAFWLKGEFYSGFPVLIVVSTDRLRMLEVISNFNPQPESVPINSLMPMPGTPLANSPQVDPFDLVRMIACTRIAVPKAKVRLSAGRTRLSDEVQALCFFAGANSIFYGEKLLTADNPEAEKDRALLAKLGLATLEPDMSLAAPDLDPNMPASPSIGCCSAPAKCDDAAPAKAGCC